MTCSCVLLKDRLVVFSQLCVLYQACVHIQSNSKYRYVRSCKKKAGSLTTLSCPLLYAFIFILYVRSVSTSVFICTHHYYHFFYRYNQYFLSTLSRFKLVLRVSTSSSHIYFKYLKDMDNTECLQNTFKQY